MSVSRGRGRDKMNAAEEIDVTIEGVLADGTPVKAKCRYRAKDISVELLSPYPGLHAGRHIMFMSPRTYTANEYWKKAAWELLEELVAQGRWISSHPDEVSARRREAKRRIGIVTVGYAFSRRKCRRRISSVVVWDYPKTILRRLMSRPFQSI